MWLFRIPWNVQGLDKRPADGVTDDDTKTDTLLPHTHTPHPGPLQERRRRGSWTRTPTQRTDRSEEVKVLPQKKLIIGYGCHGFPTTATFLLRGTYMNLHGYMARQACACICTGIGHSAGNLRAPTAPIRLASRILSFSICKSQHSPHLFAAVSSVVVWVWVWVWSFVFLYIVPFFFFFSGLAFFFFARRQTGLPAYRPAVVPCSLTRWCRMYLFFSPNLYFHRYSVFELFFWNSLLYIFNLECDPSF